MTNIPPEIAPTPQLVVTPGVVTPAEVIQQQSSTQDYAVLRYAVLGLILTVVVSLVGVLLLAYQEKTAPDGVIAAAGAAIGALATMIVRPPLFPPREK